jgi:hypothetical protein
MYKRILIFGVAMIALAAVPVLAQEDVGAASTVVKVTFNLALNPALFSSTCLEQSSKKTPTATVTVAKGKLNDTLTINLKNFKPGLDFDLFTVQNSPFDAGFPGNFGLAWYQSDIHVGKSGSGSAKINTKLVNEIFGFDPTAGVALLPTNTFHVGFWFDSPAEAADCVKSPPAATTPFNGMHNAGPNAMISQPNAPDNLGPLCLNPTGVGTCSP